MHWSEYVDVPSVSLSRHDLVLAAVPVVFLLSYLSASYALASQQHALALAALASSVPVGDGLFLNPPVAAED